MMRCAPLISITAQSVWRGTSMDDAARTGAFGRCPTAVAHLRRHRHVAGRATNRKPAGDGFVYEGNDCRGFPGRPDGYSDWTCPPKRTAAGSCGPFLFGCTWRANRKPAGEASVNEGNDCPRIFWATRRVLGLDMPSQTDRQQEAVGLFFLAAIAPKLPSPPRQHEVGRRGPPMDDALRPVDLYRRPVALHGGAAGDAPQQLDISQTHPCEPHHP